MANKGYPSQKKLSESIVGVSTKGCTDEYQTYQPNYSNQISADVINKGLFRLTAGLTVTAASTISPKRAFTCTAHGGAVGDVVRFQPTGTANPGFEAPIIQVPTANTLVLGSETPADIATNDAFYILRHITPTYADDGTITVTSSSAPIEYSLNGADTVVSMDTATPANSRPLPVQYLNTLGVRTDLATLAEQQTQTTALTAIQTAVQIMDDWDESDRAKVNLIAGQAGVAGGTGADAANVQRVSLATDIPLPAGTNIIGRLSADQSVNLTQLKGGAISSNAGTADAGTIRVAPASNVNAPTDIVAINGNVVDTNSGTSGPGTFRVALANNVALPAGGNIIGALTANQSVNSAQVSGTAISVGAGVTGTGVQRVIGANQSSATVATVNDAATSATILASSATRMGASFFNDSTESLYLKYGVTATTSDYTVKIAPGGYFELSQPCYSGIIDGIWSANASGSVKVTSW